MRLKRQKKRESKTNVKNSIEFFVEGESKPLKPYSILFYKLSHVDMCFILNANNEICELSLMSLTRKNVQNGPSPKVKSSTIKARKP